MTTNSLWDNPTTFSLHLLHVEIESAVAAAVELAAVYLPLGVVAWLVAGSIGIAHGRSFGTSVEAPGELFVDNAIPGRANDALYIHFSILRVFCHKKMGYRYNMPTLSDNFVSDTSVLPTDATTTHRRRTSPRLNQEQRKHRFEAAGSLPEVPKTRSGEAERYQFVPIPAPLLE